MNSFLRKIGVFVTLAFLAFVLTSSPAEAFSFKEFFGFSKEVAEVIKPDLVVNDIRINSNEGTNVQAGDKLYGALVGKNLFIVIENKGVVDTGEFQFKYEWLDVDGNVVGSDLDGFAGGFGVKKVENIKSGKTKKFGLPLEGNYPSGKVLAEIPVSAVSLKVTVDTTNSVSETDETNNIGFGGFELPNLKVQDIRINSNEGLSVYNGDKLYGALVGTNLFIVLENSGTVDSGEFEFKYEWLDADGNVVGSDLDGFAGGFGVKKVENIKAGKTKKFGLPLEGNYPSGKKLDEIPLSAVSLKVTVNTGAEKIGEMDSADNSLSFLLELPDISVKSVGIDTLGGIDVTKGTVYGALADSNLYITFENLGTKYVGEFEFKYEWLDADGNVVGSDLDGFAGGFGAKKVLAIGAGKTYDVGFPLTGTYVSAKELDEIPNGAVSLQVTANTGAEKIGELSNKNNSLVYNLELPDLVINWVSMDDPDLVISEGGFFGTVTGKNKMAIEITNIGKKETSKNAKISLVYLDADGKTIEGFGDSTTILSGLEVGAKKFKTMSLTGPFGENNVPENAVKALFEIDSTNQITESDENNKHLLYIEDEKIEGTPETDEVIEKEQVGFFGKIVSGLASAFKTVKKPDLTVTSVDFDEFNNPVITIKNTGEVDAGKFRYTFSWLDENGLLVATPGSELTAKLYYTMPMLKAGQSWTWDLLGPGGAEKSVDSFLSNQDLLKVKHFSFSVDSENHVYEANEKNNHFAIEVPEIPEAVFNKILADALAGVDLGAVSLPELAAPDLVVGPIVFKEPFKPTITVANVGSLKSEEINYDFGYYNDNIEKLTGGFGEEAILGPTVQHIIPELEPGQTYSFELISNLTLDYNLATSFDFGTGKFYETFDKYSKFRLALDFDNQLTESDEQNNTVEVKVPTARPNIVIKSISFSENGNPVLVLKNEGLTKKSFVTISRKWLDKDGNQIPSTNPNNVKDFFDLYPLSDAFENTSWTEFEPGATIKFPLKYNQSTDEVSWYFPEGIPEEVVYFEAEISTVATDLPELKEGKKVTVFVKKKIASDEYFNAQLEALKKQVAKKAANIDRIFDEEEKKDEEYDQEYDPDVLPGSFWYGFKELGRNIKLAFTFDEEKEIKLRFKHAAERIVENGELNDRGEHEEAAKNAEKYARDIEELKDKVEIVKRKDPKRADIMIKRIVDQELEHQAILVETEEGVVDDLDVFKKMRETREKTFASIADVLSKVSDEEIIEEVVEETEEEGETTLGKLRNLEVLTALKERVPEQAKPALDRARANSLKRFRNKYDNLDEEDKKRLPDFVRVSGGDDVLLTKVLSDLLEISTDESSRTKLDSAKRQLFRDLEEKLKDAEEKGQEEITKDLLRHLEYDNEENQKLREELKTSFEKDAKRFVERIEKQIEEIKETCTQDEWECADWGDCDEFNIKTRSCTLKYDCPNVDDQKPEDRLKCEEEKQEEVETCTEDEWRCGDWNECSVDGKQTRACKLMEDCSLVETPKPTESQSCTPPKEVIPAVPGSRQEEKISEETCTEDEWRCGDWNECSLDGWQSRVCQLTDDCSSVETPQPATQQTCTPACTEDEWRCGDWGECSVDGKQTRACKLMEDCSLVDTPKPSESQDCTPACTEDTWDCTDWDTCSASGEQTRSCTLTDDCSLVDTPKPSESQSCTPPPSRAKPDLIIDSMSMSYGSETLSQGEFVSFSAQIKNQGAGNAIASKVYLYIDNAQTARTELVAVLAGNTETANFTDAWLSAAGDYVYKICADALDVVSETDETNNCKTARFVVAAR